MQEAGGGLNGAYTMDPDAATATDLYNLFVTNFEASYQVRGCAWMELALQLAVWMLADLFSLPHLQNNRAPVGVYVHAPWFQISVRCVGSCLHAC